MKVKDVVKTLETFAPLPLQESYDNSGLQVGLPEAETSRVLLCLDVTEEVIEYAITQECSLIISHHPLLFRGVKRISNSSLVERCLRLAIKHDLTLYAAHTNLDNTQDGVSFQMAQKLGLDNIQFLRKEQQGNYIYGSGAIGEYYTSCPIETFLERVQQTFKTKSFLYAPSIKKQVIRIALCGGAGDFLIDDAITQEADVFITGEIGYHFYHGLEKQLCLIELGHYESERYVPELMQRVILQNYPQLETIVYPQTTSPIKFYSK